MVLFLSPPRVSVRSYVRRNPRKILCNGGSSETLRLISVRGRRRRRHETASQSSGPEFVFTDLGSFGRRRRAHQILFHLSAPWWKSRGTTPPPEILQNQIRAPSVFTGGGDSFPLSSHLQSPSPFRLD
ncbi:hypothetical protein F2Q70_00013679 [Brassica cretica]|uniref:Uncharacterized protein n=1 Tax=Brassica cretica TaxID=69181 RepID=A0A8S9LWR2_BRACR|nr:hypothetical protein F2Q70_00013679 [Brassica cretica]